jgi:hypothetical protein
MGEVAPLVSVPFAQRIVVGSLVNCTTRPRFDLFASQCQGIRHLAAGWTKGTCVGYFHHPARHAATRVLRNTKSSTVMRRREHMASRSIATARRRQIPAQAPAPRHWRAPTDGRHTSTAYCDPTQAASVVQASSSV